MYPLLRGNPFSPYPHYINAEQIFKEFDPKGHHTIWLIQERPRSLFKVGRTPLGAWCVVHVSVGCGTECVSQLGWQSF